MDKKIHTYAEVVRTVRTSWTKIQSYAEVETTVRTLWTKIQTYAEVVRCYKITYQNHFEQTVNLGNISTEEVNVKISITRGINLERVGKEHRSQVYVTD